MNYYELRKQISETFKKLVSENLSSHFGGNISVRLPDKPDNFLITPSGIRKDRLQPEDMVIIDINGNLVEGDKKPSIEQFLHLEIYKRRPDVNAIIHAHTIYSSAFAVARVDIPPVIEEYTLMIGGPVKVAEFAPAGSQQLAKNIADALGDRKAVLVANHGVVTCGKNLDDALTVLYSVEKSAMLYIFANDIGKPHVLPNDALQRVIAIYKKRYLA
ncbi:MAG: class II aldolase/adducin family protein [Candidatus Asgardarchaeia archaeon]